jgi:hypothetical protein
MVLAARTHARNARLSTTNDTRRRGAGSPNSIRRGGRRSSAGARSRLLVEPRCLGRRRATTVGTVPSDRAGSAGLRRERKATAQPVPVRLRGVLGVARRSVRGRRIGARLAMRTRYGRIGSPDTRRHASTPRRQVGPREPARLSTEARHTFAHRRVADRRALHFQAAIWARFVPQSLFASSPGRQQRPGSEGRPPFRTFRRARRPRGGLRHDASHARHSTAHGQHPSNHDTDARGVGTGQPSLSGRTRPTSGAGAWWRAVRSVRLWTFACGRMPRGLRRCGDGVPDRRHRELRPNGLRNGAVWARWPPWPDPCAARPVIGRPARGSR